MTISRVLQLILFTGLMLVRTTAFASGGTADGLVDDADISSPTTVLVIMFMLSIGSLVLTYLVLRSPDERSQLEAKMYDQEAQINREESERRSALDNLIGDTEPFM